MSQPSRDEESHAGADDDQRLAWLIEQSPLGIIEWDKNGNVRHWNPAATRIFGYESSEIAGESGQRLVPEGDKERFERRWERLHTSGGTARYVTDNVRKDGVRITCEWDNTLLTDDEGKRAGALSIVKDVTEERRREQTVTRLHEATRGLMEAQTKREIAQIGVETAREVLDMPYTITFLADEDDVLQPVVLSEEYKAEFSDSPSFEPGEGITGSAFATGEIEVHDNGQEDERAHPDGPSDIRSFVVFPLGEYGVLAASSPIVGAFDEGDVELAKILAANMEAALGRAEREETLARQNEQLDEFASVVSHDLRSPLSVANGALTLARETGDDEHFDRADRALSRMDHLVDDLLTLAQEGDIVGDIESVDLSAQCDAAWTTVDPTDATLERTDLGTIEADPHRLQELLENLFQNAVEHGSTNPDSQTPQDAVEHGSTSPDSQARQDAVEHAGDGVTVRVGTLDSGGFFVADDGPGIPADERDHVFEYGCSGSDGIGLGLAIVHKIVDAHGWSISITESEAGGARFEIRF